MAGVVRAAGAVVWRLKKRRLEVLLIHRPGYDDWSWPKGKQLRRESLPACAVREVKEETGVDIAVGVPLPPVKYTLGTGQTKINWYWAATAIDDAAVLSARPKVKPSSPNEVDEAVWVEAVDALAMLTRKADREPLKALLDLYADGDLKTWALLLTRHARAKKRSAWPQGEDTRPLTPTGEKQARALVPFFAAFAAVKVVSSPWARCSTTVAPYAEVSGVPLEIAPELTEDAARAAQKPARKVMTDALTSRKSTIVCTHRPVLPVALAAVRKRSPRRVQDTFPESDPYLRTGEVLILHVGARPGKRPRVVGAEIHRP